MKYIVIINIILITILSCQNKDIVNQKTLKKETIKKKEFSTYKYFHKYELEDIDEDKQLDSIFISKKVGDKSILFGVKLSSGLVFTNQNLIFDQDYYSIDQLHNYLFLDLKKNNIVISENIGINDRLDYNLYFDKNRKKIIIKEINYNFVNVNQKNTMQNKVRNIKLDSFNINNYYPDKIK